MIISKCAFSKSHSSYVQTLLRWFIIWFENKQLTMVVINDIYNNRVISEYKDRNCSLNESVYYVISRGMNTCPRALLTKWASILMSVFFFSVAFMQPQFDAFFFYDNFIFRLLIVTCSFMLTIMLNIIFISKLKALDLLLQAQLLKHCQEYLQKG